MVHGKIYTLIFTLIALALSTSESCRAEVTTLTPPAFSSESLSPTKSAAAPLKQNSTVQKKKTKSAAQLARQRRRAGDKSLDGARQKAQDERNAKAAAEQEQVNALITQLSTQESILLGVKSALENHSDIELTGLQNHQRSVESAAVEAKKVYMHLKDTYATQEKHSDAVTALVRRAQQAQKTIKELRPLLKERIAAASLAAEQEAAKAAQAATEAERAKQQEQETLAQNGAATKIQRMFRKNKAQKAADAAAEAKRAQKEQELAEQAAAQTAQAAAPTPAATEGKGASKKTKNTPQQDSNTKSPAQLKRKRERDIAKMKPFSTELSAQERILASVETALGNRDITSEQLQKHQQSVATANEKVKEVQAYLEKTFKIKKNTYKINDTGTQYGINNETKLDQTYGINVATEARNLNAQATKANDSIKRLKARIAAAEQEAAQKAHAAEAERARQEDARQKQELAQNEAATKIQAVARGNASRKSTEQRNLAVADAPALNATTAAPKNTAATPTAPAAQKDPETIRLDNELKTAQLTIIELNEHIATFNAIVAGESTAVAPEGKTNACINRANTTINVLKAYKSPNKDALATATKLEEAKNMCITAKNAYNDWLNGQTHD